MRGGARDRDRDREKKGKVKGGGGRSAEGLERYRINNTPIISNL